MATLPSFGMATCSPLGCSASCILTIVRHCHGQATHYETCAAGFTAKWTPQSMRSQTMTEICPYIRCPPDESGDGVEFDRVWGVPNPSVADLASLLGCFEVSYA